MNRIVLCGVAIFFAIAGIALIGGEEKASAGVLRGNGCGGCDGGSDCCGGHKKLFSGCHGRDKCSGSDCCGGHKKLFSGCHGRDKCSGREKCHGLFGKRCHGSDCSGKDAGCSGCEGSKEVPAAPAEAAPPAPPAEKKA